MVNTSRKFIDLIQKTTGKWASWDPGFKLEVGDFGQIDKESGSLEVKGNIYTDLHIYDGDPSIIELLKENPPLHSGRENHYFASTSDAKKTDLKLGPEVSVAGIAEASLKGQWSFGTKRGALLIMANPKYTYIPPAKLLEHLAKVKGLQDMYLVTQVFFTSAFSLYLSGANNDVISLALLGSAPIPQAPGVSAGGQASVGWWSSYSSGLFRDAQEPTGADIFAPLYTAKQIRKPTWFRRGLPAPVYEGDDEWEDADAPWELLDEDGNEDLFEDTIF